MPPPYHTALPLPPPPPRRYRRAELALSKGDEELAKEALSRRKTFAVRGRSPGPAGRQAAVRVPFDRSARERVPASSWLMPVNAVSAGA